MVVAAAAGAVAGRRVAVAGRAMAGAEGKPAFTLVAAVAETEHLTAVVVLRAAPDAAAIFPEYPHIEGRVAIVLEVEGAPPAQAACAGKRLPAVDQGCVACNGDLDRDP